MRLAVLGLALALTTSAPLAATAQAPVTTQPLAAGEVLLEVNALGSITTRADRATLRFNITGSGETEAAARIATETTVRNVRVALRRLGIADADVRIEPVVVGGTPQVSPEMADMNAVAVDLNGSLAVSDTDTMTEADAGVGATAAAEIVIRNVDRVQAVQTTLMDQGVFVLMTTPVYALNDESVPRRQARAQALQRARADADSYAAALNMRVVRVVRVSERLGFEMFGLVASEGTAMANLFMPNGMHGMGGGSGSGADVRTMVVIGVDYALAPR